MENLPLKKFKLVNLQLLIIFNVTVVIFKSFYAEIICSFFTVSNAKEHSTDCNQQG